MQLLCRKQNTDTMTMQKLYLLSILQVREYSMDIVFMLIYSQS
jgi:hypothetical protein